MAATVGPNVVLDLGERHLGVLDDVVQERGGRAGGVEAELGDDHRDGDRVGDVGLAREPELAGVGLARQIVRPADDPGVLAGPVKLQLGEQGLDRLGRRSAAGAGPLGGGTSPGERVDDGHVPGYRCTPRRPRVPCPQVARGARR